MNVALPLAEAGSWEKDYVQYPKEERDLYKLLKCVKLWLDKEKWNFKYQKNPKNKKQKNLTML